MQGVVILIFILVFLVIGDPEGTGKFAGRVANGFSSVSCEKPHDR